MLTSSSSASDVTPPTPSTASTDPDANDPHLRALLGLNPFDGSRPQAKHRDPYEAYVLLCRAEAASAREDLPATRRRWQRFADFCQQRDLKMADVLSKPTGNHKSSLTRMFASRNAFAWAHLLRHLPPGVCGHTTQFVARRISSHTEMAQAAKLSPQQDRFYLHYLNGRYLGLATQEPLSDFSAYCFRNGITYVGDIADPGASSTAQKTVIFGKDWTFTAQRQPLSRDHLCFDAERFGIAPVFGDAPGRLLWNDQTLLEGVVLDTAYGGRVDLRQGDHLRLEYRPDCGLDVLSISAIPRQIGEHLVQRLVAMELRQNAADAARRNPPLPPPPPAAATLRAEPVALPDLLDL